QKTCGVLLEPIQAEGGVRIPDARYLRGVREICDRHGILMILDEVQVGMGRTGTLFAYEDSGIRPDIMTLAKAMGNGFPVGAMLTKDSVATAFQPGNHASTFGGTPLAMAACIAVFEAMRAQGVLANCRRVGAYFLERMQRLHEHQPLIKDVRGKGLILGMELAVDGAEIVKKCMEKGLLIITSGAGNVLRFVPPLIITEKDVDQALDILEEVLKTP
ncbi:MAG: aspartate aminotransferase family protein, partial [Syntrophus sp. (in: bacteria)]|nr:aspartate aminotransferase family protein [Syntrophus sp. (in: bacteria)]